MFPLAELCMNRKVLKLVEITIQFHKDGRLEGIN